MLKLRRRMVVKGMACRAFHGLYGYTPEGPLVHPLATALRRMLYGDDRRAACAALGQLRPITQQSGQIANNTLLKALAYQPLPGSCGAAIPGPCGLWPSTSNHGYVVIL